MSCLISAVNKGKKYLETFLLENMCIWENLHGGIMLSKNRSGTLSQVELLWNIIIQKIKMILNRNFFPN